MRVWWVLQGVAGIAGIIHREKKKFFSFFTLTPSQMWLKRPVYRGFKGEGKCEGRTFTLTPALTLPSHFRHRKVSCQGFSLQNLTKVPEKYSCLVPTVQHRYTNSIAMPDYQYSYAAPLVQGCCTFTGTIICNQSACHSCIIYWVNYSGEDENHIRDDFYSRFLSLMTLFGNKILSFPIKNVSLHSRKLTPMSLFGNGYDYKKRLLFTTTYIEQVKQSHKDCNRN